MVPERWKQGTLSDLISRLDAGVSVNSGNRQSLPNEVGVLKTSCVSDGVFNSSKNKVVLQDNEKQRLSEPVQAGSIIISRMNTPVLVGANAYIAKDNNNLFLPDRLWQAKPKNQSVNMRWLAYFLSSSKGRYVLSARATGTSGSMKNITKSDVLSIGLQIPPINEQKRIAEILSTWDQAIETTEKLIANAEAQKKALMQQLLTGKKRLPGFKGEWEVTTLCSVAEILISNVDKKNIEGEELVKLCNYMDVYKNNIIESDGNYMRSTASIHQIKKFQLKVGDVIITKDSERPDDIANSSYVKSTDDNFVCGYHLAIIRPNNDIVGRYLKYYFEDPCTKHFFTSRANGVTRFGLTIPTIKSAPIRLPNSVEQQKIATILSDCELHIRQLVNNINQLKTEKAALMQQLLTGKRRVKVEEPAT